MDEKEIQRRIQNGRDFMKLEMYEEDYSSDQDLKKPQPPLCKAPLRETTIALPKDFSHLSIGTDFLKIINGRCSHRVYTPEVMTLEELSYVLWCSQGVKDIRGKKYATLRTVPSGGARHAFETYLAIRNVEGLPQGFYHYLPMTHSLECINETSIDSFIGNSLSGQVWADKCAVCLYYSMVAYRAEWRYGIFAHRVALIDAGHVTENVYLACESIGLGGCAVAALDGKYCDKQFELDGEEEFIFYSMPIGHIQKEDKQAEDSFYAFVKEENY